MLVGCSSDHRGDGDFDLALPPHAIFSLKDDKAVLEVVLTAFAETDDSALSKGGTILVHPDSAVLDDLAPYDVEEADDPGCSGLEEYEPSLVSRNSTSVPIAPVLPTSAHWRVASGREVGTPFFLLDRDSIKTKIFLALPAYSRDRTRALVRFGFLWSQHAATAAYFVTKGKAGWEVRCDGRVYWP
jgi:hypothetical protein